MVDQLNPDLAPAESDSYMAMRLYKFAQMSAQDMQEQDAGGPADEESEITFEQLKETVAWCLENGRDDIIDLAIDMATHDDDKDAIEEIEVACEFESTTALIRNDDGTELAKVSLFAIPILVNLVSGPCPEHLPLSPVFHEIVKSIREFDLVEDTSEVHIVNYLYNAEQLQRLTFSDVYRLTCNIINCASDPAADEASLLYQAETERLDEADAPVALRFLVGVASMPADGEDDESEDEEENDEARATKNLAWQRRVAMLMSHCIGRSEGTGQCIAGVFDDFFDACRFGLIDRGNFHLKLFIDQLMAQLGFSGPGLKVIMAPFGANGVAQEIRISVLSAIESKCLGIYTYPIFAGESAEGMLEEIADIFENSNFREIDVVDDVQTLSKDKGNDKWFMLARPGKSPLPPVPFPTSTLFH